MHLVRDSHWRVVFCRWKHLNSNHKDQSFIPEPCWVLGSATDKGALFQEYNPPVHDLSPTSVSIRKILLEIKMLMELLFKSNVQSVGASWISTILLPQQNCTVQQHLLPLLGGVHGCYLQHGLPVPRWINAHTLASVEFLFNLKIERWLACVYSVGGLSFLTLALSRPHSPG